MGICCSCEATSVATAKLILQDGKLQEFPYPVKVSHVLQKDPTCFICNSDEMDFDDILSAINADEELQPGQLYFALPLSRLKQPLQAEEMAALAVKASSALKKREEKCGCRRCPAVAPEGLRKRDVGGETKGCGVVVVKRNRPGRGSGRKYEVNLSAIPE